VVNIFRQNGQMLREEKTMPLMRSTEDEGRQIANLRTLERRNADHSPAPLEQLQEAPVRAATSSPS
jgi:hypothetical protein